MSKEQIAPNNSLVFIYGPDKNTSTHLVYVYWPHEDGGMCFPEASYEKMVQLSTIQNKFALDIRPGTTVISRVIELLQQQGITTGHISFVEIRDYSKQDISLIESLKANLMAFTFDYCNVESTKRSLNFHPVYGTVGVNL